MSEVPLYRLQAKSGPARTLYVRRDLYYRPTSPTRRLTPLEPYCRPMPRVPRGWGRFL